MKELRRVLGMFGWYARFIENEAEKNIPLVKLPRKDTSWEWGKDQDADSSQYAVGAVLTLEHEVGEYPIVYVSKDLTSAEKNYSTTDREMLTIRFALRKFRCYIEGYHFIIMIDHMALKFLKTVKEPASRLARWILELQEYDCEIHYKKGSLQVVADTLSRNIDTGEHEKAAFSEVKDQWYNKRLEDVTKSPLKFRDWMVCDKMLYKYTVADLLDPIYNKDEGWRLVVPTEYREQVLWDVNNELFAGHMGVDKTYEKIGRDFYWPEVYRDVRAYI